MTFFADRRALLSALAAAVLASAPGLVWAQAATQAPDALVRSLSNEVLEAIKGDRSLQSGDIGRLNKLVDDKVLPYVNFEKMTQLAVGRGWRQATPEQRAALTREFRALLVRTYAGALSSVRDQQVRMRPFRADPADTDVVVRSEIVPRRGDPIQLDYRLEKTSASWKIYNLNVMGVWLVETYRNQFAQEINAKGVDGLIATLAQRNATGESK